MKPSFWTIHIGRGTFISTAADLSISVSLFHFPAFLPKFAPITGLFVSRVAASPFPTSGCSLCDWGSSRPPELCDAFYGTEQAALEAEGFPITHRDFWAVLWGFSDWWGCGMCWHTRKLPVVSAFPQLQCWLQSSQQEGSTEGWKQDCASWAIEVG